MEVTGILVVVVDVARVVVGCDPSEAPPLPPQDAITTPAATPHATNAARRRHGGSWRARLRRSICRRAALSGAGFTALPPALPGAGGDPDAAAILCLTGSALIERFVFGSLEETRFTASVCCGNR